MFYLLSNAIKFTESGGITINVYKKESNDNKFYLIIEVIDTGIGIPPEKLTMIFEPFTQADSSTTRKYGGTGLGLAICRKLAEILNGEIQVESEVGIGSKFMFSIPVGGANHFGTKDLFFSDELHQKRYKFLLISTNDDVYAQLAGGLSAYDWQVLWLKNKQRLNAIISFYEPELVVLDVDTVHLDNIPPGLNLYYLGGQKEGSVSDERYLSIDTLLTEIINITAPTINFEPSKTEFNLLIIAENTINVLLMEKVLKRENYRIDSITDITQLKQMGNNTFDVILVDIELFRKYDESLYKQIKKINYKTLIAIAKDNDNYKNDLIDDFLYKPLTSKNLISVVEKNIKGNRYE